MECAICNADFVMPKSERKIQKLIFSLDKSESEDYQYMCPDCHHERSNSEFRYLEGEMLCIKNNCGRNAMSFSKYCFLCDGSEDL